MIPRVSRAAYDIGLDNGRSIDEIVAIARSAEAAGFDTIWIAEQHFRRGIFSIASAVAGETESLAVGFGVLSPFIRHPASISMELLSLTEKWGARFKVAFGVAHHGATRLGELPHDQVKGLEEAAIATKTLLSGGTAYVGARLERAVPDVPLFVGSIGAKTLAMSAAVYDGALLGVMCSPDFIGSRVALIDDSLAGAGRSREAYELSVLVLTAVSNDLGEATDVARRSVAYYLMMIPDVTPRLAGSDLHRDDMLRLRRNLIEKAAEASIDAAGRLIPEALVHQLAVVGTPAEVAHRLSEYRDWGIDRVIAHHALGLDAPESVELLGGALFRREESPHA